MKKNEKNLIILNSAFIMLLVLSNIFASKVVNLWGFIIPSAVVCYPFTFLITDIIGELYGKEEANKTVKLGFICQMASLMLIFVAIRLPIYEYSSASQEQFTAVLGSSFRVVFASMVGYLCSQKWDVFIFHKIRDAYIKKYGSTKGGKWIWNNASTMTSQIIDTAIFITIAFSGVVPNILVMILSQYFIKFIFALLDTPFFYYFTKESR